MPSLQRIADFLQELQQLERAGGQPGTLILDAFARHTPYAAGAVYLRDGRDFSMRLAAKLQCVAPEILDGDVPSLDPKADVILPLRSQRDHLGLIALAGGGDEDDLALVRAAAGYVATLLTNQRLLQEEREADFQLKSRLLELESLYDIGLSIASTLNIDEVADEILFRMISLTNSRRAALFLRDGARFKLYRAFGDVNSDFLDEDLAAQLLRQGTPLSFNEPSDCIFPGCSAYVAIPVKGNNETIGILAAADRETRDGEVGAFEENELRLLGLFASQAAIALENARLHNEALARQAMERELELAATIQRDILPKHVPSSERLEIATFSRPARQVGGDYHAFFEREGVMTMLVADVAGKSMPAALLVSALHAAIQLLFAEGRALGDIATELNRHIHNWSAENKFITMVMASIDREAETIEYVNCGHNPAYIVGGGRIDQIKSHGLPIGILAASRYMTQTRPFPAGSTLVLYSDGISEAENEAGEEFENHRLEAILAATGETAPAELRNRIVDAVDGFVGDAPQKDDQTLVIARTL